ncbi:MAG: AAA family ATPase [SAR324 cluster bacterium]|nr:AAA family ATPase [SAR324 cluster bacterium]
MLVQKHLQGLNRQIANSMNTLWNPSGTVLNQTGNTSESSQESENLAVLQNYFLEQGLGSGIFFRALELLKTFKPGVMKFNDDPHLCVLLVLVLLLEITEKKGSLCIQIGDAAEKIWEVLADVDLVREEISPAMVRSWLTPEGSEWLIGLPCSLRPLVYDKRGELIYFQKSWRQEDDLRVLLERRIKMDVDLPDETQIHSALEDILVHRPIHFKAKPLQLNPEQLLALIIAVHSPSMILTGGPGTGKTFITACLLRLLKRLGLAHRPILTAPTGRAAKRMSESVILALSSVPNINNLKTDQELIETAERPQTLHRLLRFHPGSGRFLAHEYAPLENDLVILDESSMVNQSLMLRLMRAIDSRLPYIPPGGRLILMGDARQLPPINPGAPFIDLAREGSRFGTELSGKVERLFRSFLPSSRLPKWEEASFPGINSVHLKTSFRQDQTDPSGRSIHAVADFLRNFRTGNFAESIFTVDHSDSGSICSIHDLSEHQFEMVRLLEQQNTQKDLIRFSSYWAENSSQNRNFRELIERTYQLADIAKETRHFDEIFEHLNRYKILCLTQVHHTGTRWINHLIQEQSKAGVPEALKTSPPLGCPVICTKNLHDLKLYNGDQGIFLKFTAEDSDKIEVKALFQVEGKYQTFYDQQLINVEPAHAITVHKSQGSEYEHVAVILPYEEQNAQGSRTVTRSLELQNLEMIYTAITRARRSVVIVGSKQVLLGALQRRLPRLSGLRILSSKNTET